MISKGIAPSQHKQRAKKAEKAAVTTSRDVAKKVLADAKKKKLAAVTIDKKEWLPQQFIYPEIGSRPIGKLKPADVLRVLKKVDVKGRLETAKRARQLMGQVFRVAAIDELATGDPTPLLRGHPPRHLLVSGGSARASAVPPQTSHLADRLSWLRKREFPAHRHPKEGHDVTA